MTISMKGHWKFKGRKRVTGGGGSKFGISREVSEYICSPKNLPWERDYQISSGTTQCISKATLLLIRGLYFCHPKGFVEGSSTP